MHTLRVEFELCCGHRLHLHEGKCNNLHGHNYTVVITVTGCPKENGMIIDASKIKKHFTELVDSKYDHACLISDKDPIALHMSSVQGVEIVSFIPTVENLCFEIFTILSPFIPMASVEIWETGKCSASYQGDIDV